MESLVPIIGIEALNDRPQLRARIESAIEGLGHDVFALNAESIHALELKPVAKVDVPFAIMLQSSDALPDNLLHRVEAKWTSLRRFVIDAECITQIIERQKEEFGLIRWKNLPSEALAVAILAYHHLSDSKFNLDSILEYLPFSKSKLESVLHASGHPGAWQLVRDIRIDQAKRLLRDTLLSVGEVAYAVGCTDLPAFSKSFRKVVGCSPSEFRQLNMPHGQNDKSWIIQQVISMKRQDIRTNGLSLTR